MDREVTKMGLVLSDTLVFEDTRGPERHSRREKATLTRLSHISGQEWKIRGGEADGETDSH